MPHTLMLFTFSSIACVRIVLQLAILKTHSSLYFYVNIEILIYHNFQGVYQP